MSKSIQKIFSILMVISFIFITSGCDEVIIGTNLQKGDKYYAKGDYQKAYEHYMKAAQEYQNRLGRVYSSSESAKEDARKMIEAYCKSGLTAEKLARDSEARAMFEKAIKDSYSIKESYYVKEEVKVPAGYADRWVPGYNKEVFVDGHYEDVWVDGGYKEVYVDGYYKETWVDSYYRQDGTFVNGYYRKTWVDGHYEQQQMPGHYEKVWKDGYYKTVYVDGHYEKVWEPAHIEYKDVYKERDVTISVDSPYIAQAKSKLPVSNTNAPAAAAGSEDPALKTAYEKMNLTYQNYIKAGSPDKGAELEAMKSARDEYQKLLEAAKQ